MMHEVKSFLMNEEAVSTVEIVLIVVEIGGTTLRSLS